MKKAKTVMFVLGGGGHTSELITMSKNMSIDKHGCIIGIASFSDYLSKKMFINYFGSSNRIFTRSIIKARAVKQSKLSAIFTTFFSIIHAFFLVLYYQPDIVVN